MNRMVASYIITLSFLITSSSFISAEILDLRGDPDFRSIHLFWKTRNAAPGPDSGPARFLIQYCEDQAWGKYRCKIKTIEGDPRSGIRSPSPIQLHQATLNGLKIATNYTVEVKEKFDKGPAPTRLESGRALGGNLFIQTKGFYARAINCLSNSSLVEIVTGPSFGGKISVEGSTDEKCSTEGNFSRTVTSYQLNINHALCGSELRNASVRTFILVQENLPILTHSTRRFMVVCNYIPETFTVRAGVNLPADYGDEEQDLVPVGNDVSEVDPSELFDSTGLLNSRVGKQLGKALKFSSEKGQEETQKWAHLILMVVMSVSAVVGISCAVYFFVRTSRRTNRSGFLSPQEEPSAIEIDENLDAVVRDFGQPTIGDSTSNNPTLPPVALTGVDFDTDFDNNNYCEQRLPDKETQDDAKLTYTKNSAIMHQGADMSSIPIFAESTSETASAVDEISSYPSISSFIGFIPGNHCNSVPVGNLESIDGVFDEIVGSNDIIVTENNQTALTVGYDTSMEEYEKCGKKCS